MNPHKKESIGGIFISSLALIIGVTVIKRVIILPNDSEIGIYIYALLGIGWIIASISGIFHYIKRYKGK